MIALRVNKPMFIVVSLFLIFLETLCHGVEGIEWLALKEEDVNGWSGAPAEETVSDEGVGCDRAQALGVYPCTALIHVARAATLAKTTCKHVHQHRRWNCSTIDLAPNFTPELLLGTKEQSFVYALSSAALTYTMARACSSGALFSCTCGTPPHELPRGNFKWGGCSDNLKWSSRFVRQFIETQENKKYTSDSDADKEAEGDKSIINQQTKTTSKTTDIYQTIDDLKNSSLNSQNDFEIWRATEETKVQLIKTHEIATLVKRDILAQKKKFKNKARKTNRHKVLNKSSLEKKLKNLQTYLQMANLQNSKAGRKLMEQSLSVQCKCHGVSGSCSIRTCWRALIPLTKVAERLWGAAGRSTRATSPYHRPRSSRRSVDLLFVSQSPNYCANNPSTGSLGTRGRWCNATSRTAEASCRYMCCGRGYETFINETLDRCNCRYIWCCKVECDVCKTTTEAHFCN